jgi:hypothetical protein
MGPFNTKEHKMKHSIALSSAVGVLAVALSIVDPTPAHGQPLPPPLPSLTQQQAEQVRSRIDAYRRDTDARVARNEITADEAERLVRWREWQIAQQTANAGAAVIPMRADGAPSYDASVPPDYQGPRTPDYVVVEPAPVYVPYYRPVVPYYYAPRPYAYWGPSVCAGGFGRHFGGRICF